MATETNDTGYPAGAGWLAGYALGVAVGLVAFLVTGEVTVGLVLLVAAGTTPGAAIEHSLDTRPLADRRRRVVLRLGGAGVVVGALAFVYVAG